MLPVDLESADGGYETDGEEEFHLVNFLIIENQRITCINRSYGKYDKVAPLIFRA